jgi:hypothetical protein
MLYTGPELVGEAVAPQENSSGLYVLQFLSVPKFAAAASSSGNGLDGEIRLVPVSVRFSTLCWLKALLHERLFSAGTQEKPMREPHVRNRIQRERRREKGNNSGRKR